MACNCGTHPSVHTLVYLQWLTQSSVTVKTDHGEDIFYLHPVGLSQPPPPGHAMAVKIPARNGANYFLVEARLRCDDYERPSYASSGIPSEGVVVYEVAAKLEVYLRTPTGLAVGGSFTPEPGLEISVIRERYGDFRITVTGIWHKTSAWFHPCGFPVSVADHACALSTLSRSSSAQLARHVRVQPVTVGWHHRRGRKHRQDDHPKW